MVSAPGRGHDVILGLLLRKMSSNLNIYTVGISYIVYTYF